MILRATAFLFLLALPLRAEIPIREVTSPGGVRAWLVEDHSIPFMALELRFRGGTSLDDPGRRGAVNLMTALIEEGTGDLDAQGFAAARDALAADMRFDAGTDSVSVSARMLTENREQALDLLRQAISAPRFDADSIERVRGQVLSNIASDDKDPSALAARAFDALAWGDHPYATSGEGTADSVAALTRDDLLAAHRATMARDRVYVAAAGDVTAEDLGRIIDELLAELPPAGAPLPGRADFGLAGGVTVRDFPVPQSVVLFGHQGMKRDDPDFFAAFLLNEVLGGGRFSARLMTEVREKRGLTYGIGTWLAPMDAGEVMMGQFSTDNATVAEAIEVVRAEWRRLAEGGVSDAELAAVKTYQTGSYPLRFEGNAQIARILVGMQVQGLPIDYVQNRNGYIEAVTAADVARVAASLLKPDDLHFVVVGQPEGMAAGD
ncbi:MAG: insulinase family protein [Paracoccaceae bacterium]|nr:MAG: insulinase family protein [Paracoccaceae bacterium]